MTTEEIKALQKELGVTADGIIGPITRAAAQDKIEGSRSIDEAAAQAEKFGAITNTTGLVKGTDSAPPEETTPPVDEEEEEEVTGPAVGDIKTINGLQYQWTGSSWELLGGGEDTSKDDFLDKLGSMFDNFGKPTEVPDIPEEVATPKQIEDLVPWFKGKGDLLQIYTDTYISTGSGDFSIAAVRNSAEYTTYYPGIKRDDGSLRMNETQYEQTREGYFRVLLENGLNPTIFDGLGKVSQLIAGDVSVPEFRSRVTATREAFVDNPKAAEIKAYYEANFNISLGDNAVFAAALDPDVSVGILNNQIDIAELGAEAALRNLDLNTNQAQRLLQAGITEEGATRLFARSADSIATLNRLSRQQNRTRQVGLEDVLQSDVFQDPAAKREQAAIIAQNVSGSYVATGARRGKTGSVEGLTEG